MEIRIKKDQLIFSTPTSKARSKPAALTLAIYGQCFLPQEESSEHACKITAAAESLCWSEGPLSTCDWISLSSSCALFQKTNKPRFSFIKRQLTVLPDSVLIVNQGKPFRRRNAGVRPLPSVSAPTWASCIAVRCNHRYSHPIRYGRRRRWAGRRGLLCLTGDTWYGWWRDSMAYPRFSVTMRTYSRE